MKMIKAKMIICSLAVLCFVYFNTWTSSQFTQQHLATLPTEVNRSRAYGFEVDSSSQPQQSNSFQTDEVETAMHLSSNDSRERLAEKPLTSDARDPQRFFNQPEPGPRYISARSPVRVLPYTTAGLLRYNNDLCGDKTDTEALDVCLADLRLMVNDTIFPERFKESDLPCYHPTDHDENGDFNDKDYVTTPAQEGLFFLKLLKTASSTSAGVHLRIARNRALRDSETSNWPVCKTRQEHGFAHAKGPQSFRFGERNPDESVLWTMIREPTDRLISEFFHLKVSRNNVPATDRNFQQFLTSQSRLVPHYFDRLWTKNFAKSNTSLVDVASEILEEYDFIGVQGRFDESLVCLMMIWNLPMSDILYMPSKLSGGYDGGQTKDTCFFIPKREISRSMQEFVNSNLWKKATNMEMALYEAANRSLDRTIDFLGREDFELALDVFRKAQVRVVEVCGDVVRFPCTKDGVRRPNEDSDCLRGDSGCGFECLDKVATELDLWQRTNV